VAAEDLPLPGPDGLELPDESMLPEFDGVPLPMSESAPTEHATTVIETGEPSVLTAPARTIREPLNSDPFVDDPQYSPSIPTGPHHGHYDVEPAAYYPWDGQPAPIESSGTWLNRGVWYAEADVIALYRIWQRGDILMAFEPVNNTNRLLFLRSAHPGQDAGVRTTLGRFLFRDSHNRDHTAEFTIYHSGDWVVDCELTSLAPNNLDVNPDLAGNNPSFNNSSFQRVIYSSRFNSFELNYRLKKRLGRDQMVMDPNGYWRREAANGFNRNYLAGFRFMEIRETLDWRAEDIMVNGANARYLINTDNDLFGFQMGEGLEYESGRWSVGISGRMGLFVNDADAHSQLNFTADDDDDFDRKNTEDELSWMGEAHVLGRFHLTPACSLRAGLDFMVLDSLALAPRQIDFIDVFSKVETGGNPYYMGGSLGFEAYW
jgi:hypothetical protein